MPDMVNIEDALSVDVTPLSSIPFPVWTSLHVQTCLLLSLCLSTLRLCLSSSTIGLERSMLLLLYAIVGYRRQPHRRLLFPKSFNTIKELSNNRHKWGVAPKIIKLLVN